MFLLKVKTLFYIANEAYGTDKKDLVEKPGLEPMWSISTIYRPGGDAITD